MVSFVDILPVMFSHHLLRSFHIDQVHRNFLLLAGASDSIVPLKWIEYGGIWGPYYNIPKAIFDLLKGDYSSISTAFERSA